MFKLKLDTLEGLSDSHKLLYTENEDGTFSLNKSVARRQDNFQDDIKKNNSELYSLKEELRAEKLRTKEKEEELEAKNRELPQNNNNLQKDQRIKELEQKFEQREQKLKQMELKVKENKLTYLLSQACKDADAEEQLISSAVKLGYSADGLPCVMSENGSVKLNENGDIMTINDYVETLRTHDVYKRAFNKEVPTGVGIKDNFLRSDNKTPRSTSSQYEKDADMNNNLSRDCIKDAIARGQKKVQERYS